MSEPHFSEIQLPTDTIPVNIAVYRYVDGDFVFIDFNEQAQKTDNISRDRVLGKKLTDVFPAVKEFGLFDVLLSVQNNGGDEKLDVKFYKDQRISGWRANKISKLPNGDILTFYWDLTTQKRYEQESLQQKKQLEQAQKIAHLGSWEWDIKTNAIKWSDEAFRIFGEQPQSFVPTYERFLSYLYKEERIKLEEAISCAFENKEAYIFIHRINQKGGTIRYVQESGSAQFNEQGTPIAMIGTILDITEQEIARNHIELSPAIFFHWKAETGWPVIFVTRNISQFGYTREDFIDAKVNYIDIIHPDDRDKVIREVMQFTGENRNSFEQEYRIITHDGKVKWIDDRTTIERDINDEVLSYTGVIIDITERKKSLKALGKSEIKYRRLLENLTGHYFCYTHNTEGVFTYISDSMTGMLGYTQNEFLTHYDKYLTDDLMNKRVHFYTSKVLQGEQQLPYELSVYHKEGSILYLEVIERPLFDEQNKVIGVEGIARNITDKYYVEQAKEEQQKFLQSIIDGINDPVMVIDKDYHIKLMNNKVRDKMDASIVADMKHPKCYEVSHYRSIPCDGKDHVCPLKEVIKTKKNVTVVHNHSDPRQNKNLYLEVSSTPLWDHEHRFIGVIESARDITAHLQIQDQLREQKDVLFYQANHDALTQLPNRLLLLDRLKQTIKKAHRNKKKVAVLFIDLDHFKEINDSLGHKAGDEILKEASIRLQLCVRGADTVARLGGDEFTIIIDDIKDNEIITEIATKIIQELQDAFLVQRHKLYVTSSIGISMYPNDADCAEELLRNADAAMYKAKEEGRNTYRFYTEDMTQRAFEHIRMESNLRHALKHKELTVNYQPQVNGKTHQLIGIEALVRWQHPKLGLIPPDRFIPVAEKTGLIIPLGEQVFDLVTKQMASWMQDHEFAGRMAINLSARQLRQKNIIETLSDKLKENDCKPEWIEIEITEDSIMDDPEQATATLQKIRDIGIEITIDDFGTGYSSLSYLKRLPVSKIKIDQSFVRDLLQDEDDRVIITSTISLAKNMRFNVIAEGVETKEQKDFLLEQGCEMIQGDYYSCAVPENVMTKILTEKIFKAENS
ncbi:MAG: EAL domain-containing protein [Gammaproteobacteria bacterium]|nr:EAL domain-containing protein [Gammaproteobacteria bacterium]